MTQTTDGAFKLIENMAAFSANENQESDRSEKVNSADVGEKYSMKGLLQLPGSCPQQVPDSCPQVPGSYPWAWVPASGSGSYLWLPGRVIYPALG